MEKILILAFYQFININDLESLKNKLTEYCVLERIKGTILLSCEGINGTVAGSVSSIEKLISILKTKGFNNINEKKSDSEFMPFPRLKIKLKDEIVTFREQSLDMENNKGQYVKPENWNELISDENIVLVDVRNNFEVKMGSFKSSLNPETESFIDFKNFALQLMKINKNKKIAMFCTGGIRCEKASSYLVGMGAENVFQLEGGILNYLEKIKEDDSMWEGECFVFDRRVSLTENLDKGTYTICSGCRNPINKNDEKSKYYEKGVSCKGCFNLTSDSKKLGLREREKQKKIAIDRNKKNPFVDISAEDYFESGI